MSVIGLMGTGSSETGDILRGYNLSGDELVYIDGTPEETDTNPVQVSPSDILVLSGRVTAGEKRMIPFSTHAVFVINSDKRYKLPKDCGLIVSYGFNSKACVTASSITDSDMLICVQRRVPTLSGGFLLQQEFPVSLVGHNPEYMLAAVTALLVLNRKNAE